MRVNNILIVGNYGAGNLGDDSILGGILEDLKAIGFAGKISVTFGGVHSSTDIYKGLNKVPFVPAGLRSRFGRGGATRRDEAMRAIRDADLIILGGGGLFTDEESFFAPLIWYKQASAFVRAHKPYICYGQSVGALKSWWNRYLTKLVFSRALAVHVRDHESAKLLEKLGIEGKKVTVGIDPAISYFKEISKEISEENARACPALAVAEAGKGVGEKAAKKSDILLLSLRLWPKFSEKEWNLHVQTAKNIAEEQNLKPVLLGMDTKNEKEISLLRDVARKNDFEVFEPVSARSAYEGIAKAKMLIGMRLHSIIMATCAGTSYVAIPYSPKVEGFLKNHNTATLQNQAFLRRVFETL
ncbi:MAG: polysaccharide pyruvyl transferase family protein [Candidatus Gracilibacteria bacterium]|jgi:polysaccharide pyruvyl transferase WcaK-like protein